jgi:hypothetical protein
MQVLRVNHGPGKKGKRNGNCSSSCSCSCSLIITRTRTITKTYNRTNPGTEAEPQQIVAQRLLSCLQYHVPIKSSTEDLTRPTFCIVVKYRVD